MIMSGQLTGWGSVNVAIAVACADNRNLNTFTAQTTTASPGNFFPSRKWLTGRTQGRWKEKRGSSNWRVIDHLPFILAAIAEEALLVICVAQCCHYFALDKLVARGTLGSVQMLVALGAVVARIVVGRVTEETALRQRRLTVCIDRRGTGRSVRPILAATSTDNLPLHLKQSMWKYSLPTRRTFPLHFFWQVSHKTLPLVSPWKERDKSIGK